MNGRTRRSVSPKTVGFIVGIALVSFALAILLTAFVEHLGDPISAGTDSFSRSALGHRGLVGFLQRIGLAVEIRRAVRGMPGQPGAVWLVAEPLQGCPTCELRNPAVDRIVESAIERDGPLLLVLPKWDGTSEPARPRWVDTVRLLETEEIRDAIGTAFGLLDPAPALLRRAGEQAYTCVSVWGGEFDLRLRNAQLLLGHGSKFEPIVTCGDETLVARVSFPEGASGLYLMTDPDLLNNHGLGQAAAAELVAGLFVDHLGAETVVIDETVHGFTRSSGILAEMFRFPLVLLVIHGVLVLALVLWAGLGRFGKPRSPGPAIESGKEVLIDNTAKLIGVAGHTARILPSFFGFTVRAVAAGNDLPANLAADERIVRLRELAKNRDVETDLGRLRDDVEGLAKTGRRAPERAVRIAVRLHRWQREMTDVG